MEAREKTKYLKIYLIKSAKAGYLYLKFTKIATNERLIKGYNGGMQGEFALGGHPVYKHAHAHM